MTILFIVSGLFCLLVYVLDKKHGQGESFFEMAEKFQEEEPQEEITPAKHNRRVQQILKRERKKLQDWEIELNYRNRETTIDEKLVLLGRTEVRIGEQRVELQQMLLQITQQNNLIELRNEGLLIAGQKIELRELLSDLKQRENMVVLQRQEILIDGKKVEARQLLNQIEHRENLIALEQKDIVLNGKRVELKELLADVIYQAKMVSVGKAEIELGKREIQIDGKRVELKELMVQIQNEKNLAELRHKEITLDGKRVELKDLLSEIVHQGKMVKVGKAELALGWKELKHAYNLKVFELQKNLHHIRDQMEQLRLAKISFRLDQQQEAMKLYAQKLSQTEQHIRQMYAIRLEWLKIQNKENQLDYREQRTKVQNLFNETQSKIRELHLTRWENEMIWDKKEMKRRWNTINYIEEMWYYNSGIPVEKNMLEHYRKAGFVPNSPLAQENQQLRGLISQLESQLPSGR